MAIMSNYYLLSGKNKLQVAMAVAPKDVKLAQDLIIQLEGYSELPFELNLVRSTSGKNGLVESEDLTHLKEVWLDYQPNSLAWPLMSEKLKIIIEKRLTGNEKVDWITAVINGKGEQRKYYIPRFNKMLDVLDMQKTIFVQGTDHIIKPVFSLSKISSYGIFSKPLSDNLWKITPGIYVNEEVKKAIQNEKLKGVDFEKTSAA